MQREMGGVGGSREIEMDLMEQELLFILFMSLVDGKKLGLRYAHGMGGQGREGKLC